MIDFAGRRWRVKHSGDLPSGPGPNFFSDARENVWVDDVGRLHLAITRREGKWYAAEVISDDVLGLGTYRWYVDTRLDLLPSQAVVGLFTWDDDETDHHREIDIEFGRFGDPEHPGAQFVVHPAVSPQHTSRFAMPKGLTQSMHGFTWTSAAVSFFSAAGHPRPPQRPREAIARFNYDGKNVPSAGEAHARVNLWLLKDRGTDAPMPAEIVVTDFVFETIESGD